MSQNFIERSLFIKSNDKFKKTKIKINKPKKIRGKMFQCEIYFLDVEKYDAIVEGIDEFHAIECAMYYVKSICNNSIDPEFFIRKNETMLGFEDDPGELT